KSRVSTSRFSKCTPVALDGSSVNSWSPTGGSAAACAAPALPGALEQAVMTAHRQSPRNERRDRSRTGGPEGEGDASRDACIDAATVRTQRQTTIVHSTAQRGGTAPNVVAGDALSLGIGSGPRRTNICHRAC